MAVLPQSLRAALRRIIPGGCSEQQHLRPLFLPDKLATITAFGDFCMGGNAPAHPLEMFLEVSNLCDLRCTMCSDFSGHNPHRAVAIQAKKRGFIDTGNIIECLDSLLRHALTVHCFGGGEPTIHPDFRRIVEHVARYEVLIDFFTHGKHLDELADFLVEKGVHKVTVSFSGLTRDVYDKYYLGGDFERVLAGLRRIAERKRAASSPYPLVEINSLSFRPHVATFDAFVAMMSEHGVDTVHLKQLQRWPQLFHINEHISIFRPWVEGEVLDRAAALGRRLGVAVDASQYVAAGVGSEEEYRLRVAELEREAATAPSGPPPARTVANVRSLGLGESREVVDSLFATGPAPLESPFYCMEPFKTLFVTRNGPVRPCCFHNHWSWHLGDAGQADPMAIWTGVGYAAMREAIVAGNYPMELCGPCLSKRMGPPDHGAHDQIRTYLAWHRARFGPVLGEALAERAPAALNDIAVARPEAIIARQRCRPRKEEVATGADPLAGLPYSPMIDHTVASVLEGNLERVGEEVVGWVWSPLMPDLRLPVSIWRGSRLLARSSADIMRQDLLAAGKGDGAHGFHILLPVAGPDLVVTVGDDPDCLRFHPPAPATAA